MSKQQRVLELFQGVDMRNGHVGLAEIARKGSKKINVDELEIGEYAVFINKAQTRMKLYAANGVVASAVARPGERLNILSVPHIVASFGASGRMDYDAALKQAIKDAMKRREELKQIPKSLRPSHEQRV